MKTKYTKLIGAATSLSLLSFFSPSVWAEDSTNTTASPDYSPSYSLEEVSDTNPANGLTITKYVYVDGTLSAVQYNLVFNDSLGDDNAAKSYYFKWDTESASYVSVTDADEIAAGNYDLVAKSDATGKISIDEDQTSPIDQSFVDMESTSLGDSALSITTASVSEINGDFIANAYSEAYPASTGAGLYILGASSTESEYIASINGNFIGNQSYSATENVQGGALYVGKSVIIDNITGDFIGNSATTDGTTTAAWGGAIILNYAVGSSSLTGATINCITGDFIANYVSNNQGSQAAYGGAICNYDDTTINYIYGDFIGNYTTAGLTTSFGGAIFNYLGAYLGTVVGDFMGNYAYSSSGSARGGAIANVLSTTSSLNSDFIANYASSTSSSAYGGAIYNYATSSYTSSIGSVVGDFIGNYASGGTLAYGGAIANNTYNVTSSAVASIGSITGDFIGNYVTSGSSVAKGGAIFNNSNTSTLWSSIGVITGNFIGNYASSSNSTTWGGAIFNYYGTITGIVGDFTGNYISTTSTGASYGGAIMSYYATIGYIEGDFTGNYIESANGDAQGGAINNNASGTIGYVEGDFTGNYVNGTVVKGGAVYSSGTITFKASDDEGVGTSYSYTGNYATTSSDAVPTAADDANGGFLYNDGGTVTFDVDTNSSITIGNVYADEDEDEVNDYAGYDSIAGSGSISKIGAGTLTVNSSMAYYLGALNIEEGTFNYTNSAILGADSLTIGTVESGAESTTATFASTASALGTLSVVVNSDGNLSLSSSADGDTLSASITGEGTVSIEESAEITTDLQNINAFNGIVNIAEGASLAITGDLSSTSSNTIINEGTLVADATYLTYTGSNSYINNDNGLYSISGGTILTYLKNAGGAFEIAEGAQVGSKAYYINTDLTNAGTLALDGSGNEGILTGNIISAADVSDSVIIAGEITVAEGASIGTDSLTVFNSSSSLTADADSLEVSSISNAGSLVLSDGEIDYTITGAGNLTATDTTISASVTAGSVDLLSDAGSTSVTATVTADDIDIEGTVVVSGEGALSSDGKIIDITATGDLTASASAITATEISNAGDLALTGGELSSAVTGEGDVTATDTTISASVTATNVELSSTEENTTSVGASVTAGDISITGDVVVTSDGKLTAAAAGDSTGTIAITSEGSLASNASLLVADSITNAGDLVLTGGELSSAVTGTGDVTATDTTISASVEATNVELSSTEENTTSVGASVTAGDIDITGDVVVTSDGKLTAAAAGDSTGTIAITSEGSLESNASLLVADSITNAGDLTLTGGNLSANINYTDAENYTAQGSLYITDDVTAASGVYVATGTLSISEDVTFGITADNLIVESIENDGDIVLDGNLDTEITGDGEIIVEDDTTLTTDDAGNLGNDVSNEGTLTLTGGELSSAITGEGDVVATDTTISASVEATKVELSSDEGTTSVGASITASDIDITGTVVVTSDGKLTSEANAIEITDAGKLTSNADSLEVSSIANAGSLVLSDGEIDYTITGEGDVVATDTTISARVEATNVELSSSTSLTSVGASITASDIDITGTVEVTSDGKLTSSSLEIESGASLSADLSNLDLASLDNDGTLSIVGNTSVEEDAVATDLSFSITGEGDVNITGAVSLEEGVSIEATNLNNTGELTASASDLDVDSIINTGTLNLTEGELSASINYIEGDVISQGTITITGTVTATDDVYVGADSLYIAADSSFEISTSNLSFKEITSDGELSLDGDLDTDISGEGSIDLSSDTEDETDVATISAEVKMVGDITVSGNVVIDDESGSFEAGESIVVNEDSTLTSDADRLTSGEGIENSGTLTLTGGTLTTSIVLTTDEDGNAVGDVVISTNATDESGNSVGETTYAVEDVYSNTFTVESDNTYTKSEDATEEVAVYSNEYSLEDGATLDVDTISNYHPEDADSAGITFYVGESVTIKGDIVANSDIDYTKQTGATSASADIYGSIDLTESTGEGWGIMTIDENVALTIYDEGTIKTGYTNAEKAGDTDAAANSAVVIGEGASLTFNAPAANSDTALFTNVGTIDNSGTIALEDYSTTKGDLVYVADSDTVEANGIEDLYSALNFNYDDLLIDATEDGLTFSYLATDNFTSQAETENELVISQALDAVDASTGDYTADLASSTLKLEAESNGVGSYIMQSSSYLAEVNSMLLSNMNFANISRARSLMAKASGAYSHETIDDIDNEAPVSAIEVPAAYNNLAQLQSINLLGSKDASNGVAGYDYWSVGATANIDAIAEENLVAGISLGGTYNKVEGDAGDNANSTAFLLNAYAAINVEELGFGLFTNLGYAHFWNEGSKNGAKADWDSDALNFLVGISHDIDTDIEGFTLSPVAMFNLVIQDNGEASYSNGINVDSDVYVSAKLMLGLEAQYAISSKFNTSYRLMYAHEFGDKTYDMTYGFANGIVNGLNYTGGEAGRDATVLGFGMSYDFSDSCIGFIDYNAYIYKNLITHSLNLSIGLKF